MELTPAIGGTGHDKIFIALYVVMKILSCTFHLSGFYSARPVKTI